MRCFLMWERYEKGNRPAECQIECRIIFNDDDPSFIRSFEVTNINDYDKICDSLD